MSPGDRNQARGAKEKVRRRPKGHAARRKNKGRSSMANEPTAAPAGVGSPPAGPELEPRAVAGGRGASWWTEGWRLFTPGVGVWILAAVILLCINIALNFVPVIGPLAAEILFPVFVGGLMLGCRAIDRGNPLTLSHVFAGFSQRAGPLV